MGLRDIHPCLLQYSFKTYKIKKEQERSQLAQQSQVMIKKTNYLKREWSLEMCIPPLKKLAVYLE